MGTFAVGEIPDGLRELISWVAYFAGATSEADRPAPADPAEEG
jgi:hypothetical protein